MSELDVRPYEIADEPAVLRLLSESLGWVPDEHYARFFRWKHRENPFGASWAWVAVHDDEIVGFRTFVRWQFDRDGQAVQAARAVDTATHPAHQGKGIFSLLTRHGLTKLGEDGVSFVFNTPNQQSRPGYLKMGWTVVGRVPTRVWPSGLGALVRMARSRTPAGRWSLPGRGGVEAAEALSDGAAVDALLAAQGPSSGGRFVTTRSAAYLAWRYAGFPPLAYRAHLGGSRLHDGVVLYRLRPRGAATEAVVAEVLVPAEARRSDRAALVRAAVRASGADYGIGLGRTPGLVPLPRQGPILTWRQVSADATPPPLSAFDLSLGDIELL